MNVCITLPMASIIQIIDGVLDCLECVSESAGLFKSHFNIDVGGLWPHQSNKNNSRQIDLNYKAQ